MKKLILATFVSALTFAGAASANSTVNSDSVNNAINNQSSQTSQGVVSVSPTVNQYTPMHHQNMIGNASCGESTIFVNTGANRMLETNQFAGQTNLTAAVGFSVSTDKIWSTLTGKKTTCEIAQEATAIMNQKNLEFGMFNQCEELKRQGRVYVGNDPAMKKACASIDYSPIGREIEKNNLAKLEVEKSKVEADQIAALRRTLQEKLALKQLCNEAEAQGDILKECLAL